MRALRVGKKVQIFAHESLADAKKVSSEIEPTCWIFLGQTNGRGQCDQTGQPDRSRKDIFGYPLVHKSREELDHV
jgi:hypothetical protein